MVLHCRLVMAVQVSYVIDPVLPVIEPFIFYLPPPTSRMDHLFQIPSCQFYVNKLDDRIEWLDRHTDEYLRQLADMDETEEEALSEQLTREELEVKLKETQERLERYRGYRAYMEENGLSQMSLTDPEAKLMKSKNGFIVAYNVQTAVDSETHMIEDYLVTDHVTDHGLIGETVAGIKRGQRKGS